MPVSEASSVFVVDNGGYTLKAGFASADPNAQSDCRLIPNCITKAKSEKRRAFIGDQIDDCRDLSSLFYMLSYQKGYLINWDHQKTVWDYTFGKKTFNLSPKNMSLIMTEPYFNFASIKEGLSEILFEEYQFNAVFRTNPADLSVYNAAFSRSNEDTHGTASEKVALVVDSGYSFTHIVPYVNGVRIKDAVVRIDVGGKMLTNHLKEIVSYRQIHVLDETHVMNAAKEDACFVSKDFTADMRVARAESRKRRRDAYDYQIAREYVLPDFTLLRRGLVRPILPVTNVDEREQCIILNNERFTVPELLFNPSDVGIMQMGIPEAISYSISKCDSSAHPWLYKNIILTGGSCCFPNFKDRIENEVRKLAPHLMDVLVTIPPDPVQYSYLGGTKLAHDDCLSEISVSREEYFEHGEAICEERYFL